LDARLDVGMPYFVPLSSINAINSGVCGIFPCITEALPEPQSSIEFLCKARSIFFRIDLAKEFSNPSRKKFNLGSFSHPLIQSLNPRPSPIVTKLAWVY
jgi:hypothetical protein